MLYHYNAHRQIIKILPMCIDILTQLRYNALWQYWREIAEMLKRGE